MDLNQEREKEREREYSDGEAAENVQRGNALCPFRAALLFGSRNNNGRVLLVQVRMAEGMLGAGRHF